MENVAEEFRIRRKIGLAKSLSRGAIPRVELTDYSLNFKGLNVFLTVTFVVFVCVLGFLTWEEENRFSNAFLRALIIALNVGLFITLLYYVSPIFKVFGYLICYRRRASREYLNRFSIGQNFVCVLLISAGLFYLFNHFWGDVTVGWHMVVIVFFVV